MNTHNIQFIDKIRILPEIFVFWSYRKNFVWTQKQVRISHGKRVIGVRAIPSRHFFYKSTAGRYRPVSYHDGPITARYRFIKNAGWVEVRLYIYLRIYLTETRYGKRCFLGIC